MLKKAPGIFLFSRRGHMKVLCALDFWEVFEFLKLVVSLSLKNPIC